MNTFEINVGSCGSELHRKLQSAMWFDLHVFQYSAGGDPYMIRLVVSSASKKETSKLLKSIGVTFTILKGSRSF